MCGQAKAWAMGNHELEEQLRECHLEFAEDVKRLVDRLAEQDPAEAVYPRAAHMALLEAVQSPGDKRLLQNLDREMDAEMWRQNPTGDPSLISGLTFGLYHSVVVAREGEAVDERQWAWQRKKKYQIPPTVDDVSRAYTLLIQEIEMRLALTEDSQQ